MANCISENLLSQIEMVLDKNMRDFLEYIREEYCPEEDSKKLLKDWEDFKQGNKNMESKPLKKAVKTTAKAPVKKVVKKAPVKKVVKKVVEEEPEIEFEMSGEEEEIPPSCPYILKTGKNKGNQCGVKKVQENGFCTRHKNSENTDKYPPHRIIKKHISLKKWWNPTTRFVFRDEKDLVVIGRTTKVSMGGTCPLKKLTTEDIEECKKYGYKFDLSRSEETKKESKSKKEDVLIQTDIKPTEVEEPAETPEDITEMVQKFLDGDVETVLEEIKISKKPEKEDREDAEESDLDEDLPSDSEESEE